MKKKIIKEISNTELLESINRSFSGMEEKINLRFSKIEEKITEIDQNVKATRRDMLSMGDQYVSYHKFDELASRVAKLEKNKK